MYCLDKDVKPILAVSKDGNHPIQPMISKFKSGTAQSVIKLANEMANDMINEGINVVRVKVESMMSNKGVPTELNQKEKMDEQYYFEFHFKVVVKNSFEWERLEKVCELKGAYLSFNAFKKETIPLITLRLSADWGSIIANKAKEELLELLKIDKFDIIDGIQSEFSVYDSNPALDKGWLF